MFIIIVRKKSIERILNSLETTVINYEYCTVINYEYCTVINYEYCTVNNNQSTVPCSARPTSTIISF